MSVCGERDRHIDDCVVKGFDSWREDRSNKTANKPKALVQVNSFLESIKPKEADEGDDEGVPKGYIGRHAPVLLSRCKRVFYTVRVYVLYQ